MDLSAGGGEKLQLVKCEFDWFTTNVRLTFENAVHTRSDLGEKLMGVTNFSQKLRYLIWAALQFGDNSCPVCQSKANRIVRRKYLFTALLECRQCGLRYRIPKMSSSDSDRFYQSHYSQGFTTELPDDQELKQLTENRFVGTEKDYQVYVAVLRACGLAPGSSILDFGCSWGYGSWQLKQAGYTVYSYEVSRPRAEYARQKLDCQILSRPEGVPQRVDCLFSAHVIEHLANPGHIFEVAQAVLKPSGKIVAFMPNGDPDASGNPNYHRLWGLVHPNLLTSKALSRIANRAAFQGFCQSSPYDIVALEMGETNAPLTGMELLFVAQPQGKSPKPVDISRSI
jgi:SAM-dependent methyltransferase